MGTDSNRPGVRRAAGRPAAARRLRGPALAVAAVVLTVAGCSDDSDGGDTRGADDPTSDAPVMPAEDGSAWAPTIPEQPVDPDTVLATYADVVDAATQATPGDQTWTDAAVTTEPFDDLCVVKVESVSEGGTTPDPDELREALDPAVSDAGFADLDVADDPGGALLLVAHDDADALFEWRGKTGTTVAVRVATAASECQG